MQLCGFENRQMSWCILVYLCILVKQHNVVRKQYSGQFDIVKKELW